MYVNLVIDYAKTAAQIAAVPARSDYDEREHSINIIWKVTVNYVYMIHFLLLGKKRSLFCGGIVTSGFNGTSKFITFKSHDCINLFNSSETAIADVGGFEQKSPANKIFTLLLTTCCISYYFFCIFYIVFNQFLISEIDMPS